MAAEFVSKWGGCFIFPDAPTFPLPRSPDCRCGRARPLSTKHFYEDLLHRRHTGARCKAISLSDLTPLRAVFHGGGWSATIVCKHVSIGFPRKLLPSSRVLGHILQSNPAIDTRVPPKLTFRGFLRPLRVTQGRQGNETRRGAVKGLAGTHLSCSESALPFSFSRFMPALSRARIHRPVVR